MLTVQLGIKKLVGKEKTPETVYFKVDGGRFDNEKTVKLHTEAVYQLSLVLRPAATLTSLTVEGTTITACEVKPPEGDEADPGRTTYTAEWSTAGVPPSKKGGRSYVPVVLQLRDLGTLTLHLQLKLYPAGAGGGGNQHATWGATLTHILYNCHTRDGSDFIDVVNETFR